MSSASGGGATRRPSDEGAVGHIGSMNQPGLAWFSRQMRRQAASAAGKLMISFGQKIPVVPVITAICPYCFNLSRVRRSGVVFRHGRSNV